MIRVLAVLAGIALVVGILFAATLAQRGVSCEACLEWKGTTYCGRVSAPTRDEAAAGAVRNACGVLARGVTDGLACQRTPPKTLRCDP